MSKDLELRLPNYSLSNALEKSGISITSSVETVYWLESRRRVVGLYSIEWDAFQRCIYFLTQNSWSIGILSAREDFAFTDKIETSYLSQTKDSEHTVSIGINWLTLAESICPTGDFILKTEGAFDDKDRMLKLIFSTQMSFIFD